MTNIGLWPSLRKHFTNLAIELDMCSSKYFNTGFESAGSDLALLASVDALRGKFSIVL